MLHVCEMRIAQRVKVATSLHCQNHRVLINPFIFFSSLSLLLFLHMGSTKHSIYTILLDIFYLLNLIPTIFQIQNIVLLCVIRVVEFMFFGCVCYDIAPVIGDGSFWSGCVVFFGCIYCYVLSKFVIKNGWLWSGCESHNF